MYLGDKMKYIKRIVVIVLVLSVAFGSVMYYYRSQAVSELVELGYDKTKASQMVKFSNMFEIDENKKNELETKKEELKTSLIQEIGADPTTAPITEDMVLVEQVQVLDTFYQQLKTEHQTRLDDLLTYVSQQPVTIIEEGTLIQRYQANYDQTKNYLVEAVIKAGGIQSKAYEIINDEDPIGTIASLQTMKEEIEYNRDVNGFYYEREAAMVMFDKVNAYRASQGLSPYTYADSQQECVDIEATAYSSNKNPHNWLCKAAANENAGISSIRSDYVQIAMDFFITDPPHHVVLVGNYRSAAVSIVVLNGVAYMILDVFN